MALLINNSAVQRSVDESLGSATVSITRNIMRAESPNSLRLESRIRDLNDMLELERESRMRIERELESHQIHIGTLNEDFEETLSANVLQSEAIKKRDAEINRLNKELEHANQIISSTEAMIKRKYNTTVADLSNEIELLQKAKGKVEKEKSSLMHDIDEAFLQLDVAMKAKSSAESRLAVLEQQLQRLQQLIETLQQESNSFTHENARLQSTNQNLQVALQESEAKCSSFQSSRTTIQLQCDKLQSSFEEEQRLRSFAQTQLQALQLDFQSLSARFEEESEAASALRNQVARLNADLASSKSKYEQDLQSRVNELDENRRKFNLRINELEDMATKEQGRAANLEKVKTRLSVELNELHVDFDKVNSELAETQKRANASHALATQLQHRLDDANVELAQLRSQNGQLLDENNRTKTQLSGATEKLTTLERENRQLLDQWREAKNALRDANRRIADLESIKLQLESERNNLASGLHDAEVALKELDMKYQSINSQMSQLKSDLESQLRAKDVELENLKKSSKRRIDELTISLSDAESKYKSETSRLKQKYELTIVDMEAELGTLRQANEALARENGAAAQSLRDQQLALEEESRAHQVTADNLQSSERRRAQVQRELDQALAQIEVVERAHRATKAEADEMASRINDLTGQLAALTNEKRRVEEELGLALENLSDAQRLKQLADEKAANLTTEVNRLVESLKIEQANFKQCESVRISLEIEIRELNTRLIETEEIAAREGKRVIQRLNAKINELESLYETESRRVKDVQSVCKRYERTLKEQQTQIEDDHRVAQELQITLDKANARINQYKRQIGEMEDNSALLLRKYKQAQNLIEESEQRVDLAERSRLNFRRSSSGMIPLLPPADGANQISIVRKTITHESNSSNTTTSGISSGSTGSYTRKLPPTPTSLRSFRATSIR